MVERTEEQKVTLAPIVVTLGGEEYRIAPLVIRDSREWRKKAAPFQAVLVKYAAVKSDDTEEFERILVELMGNRIDQVIDLFFEYARDLDRDEIEGKATDAEISAAFSEVVKVAFPFGV